MSKYGVGIDVGSNFIKIAEIRKQNDRYFLTNTFSLKIGSPEIDGKEAVFEPQLQEILKGRLENSGFRRGTLGIAGKDVLYRYIHFPPVPPWKLDMMVEFEVKQGGDDSEENEISYDFQLLSLPKGLSNENTVLASMAKSQYLNRVLQAIKSTGLKIDRVEPGPLSLYNVFVSDVERLSEKTVIFADIGAKMTDIVILSERNLYFVRTLPVGGDVFTEALKEEFGVSVEEAEDMKIAKGEIFVDRKPEGADREAEKISEILKRGALQISSQIQATIRFASKNLKLNNLKIDEYYISGGGARLKGLLKYWQSVFDLPVRILNPYKNIGLEMFPKKRMEEITEVPSVYSNAIGLALSSFNSGMAAMNILPEKEKKQIEFLHRKLPVYISLAVFFIASLMFSLFNSKASGGLEDMKESIDSAKRSIEAKKAMLKDEVKETASVVEKYDYIISKDAPARLFLWMLDCFSAERSDEVWLKDIGVTQSSGALNANLVVFAKESETQSAQAVFKGFRNRLLAREEIESVEVTNIESVKGSEASLKQISFTVVPALTGGK